MNAANTPTPIEDSKDGRDFEKLVKWASALSIAVTAGFLASLKQLNPSIQIQLSALSVIAFIAGGAVTLLFFRAILGGNKRRRMLLIGGVAIATLLGFFILGIKNASPENRGDVVIGTLAAVSVLSCVAWLLWRVTRFFEADRQPNRENPK
jgi:hypothetical protein